MEQEISSKRTKNEILQAYNELLLRLKEEKEPDLQEEKKQKEEKEIVGKASLHSVETIVKNLAESKLSIVKTLDELEEHLIAEHRKLSVIRQAIEIEEKNLEEVYEIKANADGLTALLLAQREKKVEFETEMSERRFQWEKEWESIEQSQREATTQAEKERAREEDEYVYDLQIKRKKETDAYEAKRASMEKELEEKRLAFERDITERESLLAEQEQEYAELKAKVESFPDEIQKAVADAENAVRRDIELTYGHQAELTQKEIESERKLSQQTISALEAKIKEQEELIRQLARKTDESSLQVQNIAIKALEGASTQRIAVGNYEKGREKE